MNPYAEDTTYVIDTAVCVKCSGSTFDRFGKCRASLWVDYAGKVEGPYCPKCYSAMAIEAIISPTNPPAAPSHLQADSKGEGE